VERKRERERERARIKSTLGISETLDNISSNILPMSDDREREKQREEKRKRERKRESIYLI
jgi:hypothetical protein